MATKSKSKPKSQKPTTTINREQWLVQAMDLLVEHYFTNTGRDFPTTTKLQVAPGFPRTKGKGVEAIGQCWSPKLTKDGTTHIFISPVLGDDPVRVLDVLLHELMHAYLGVEAKHGKEFKALQKEFGLEGKPTATIAAPGTPTHDHLTLLLAELPPYPHDTITLVAAALPKSPSGGGWIRYQSTTEESYKVVISPKSLDQFGAPKDPWGEEMVPVIK